MKRTTTKHYDIDGSKILELLHPRLKDNGWKIKERTQTSIDMDYPVKWWSWGGGERSGTVSADYENQGCSITVTSYTKLGHFDPFGIIQNDVNMVFSIIDEIVMELKSIPR